MIKLTVSGMTCEHCVKAITSALTNLPGVDKVVEVSLDRSVAIVEGQPDVQCLIEAVREEGYEARVG